MKLQFIPQTHFFKLDPAKRGFVNNQIVKASIPDATHRKPIWLNVVDIARTGAAVEQVAVQGARISTRRTPPAAAVAKGEESTIVATGATRKA